MASASRRKFNLSSLLIMDVPLDMEQGESIIKVALEQFGCSNGLQDVKWNVNKYTKQPENNCIIKYKSEDFAATALEQLQNKVLPGTKPPMTFNLIRYPPSCSEENLLYVRKCCYGLVMSGYLKSVTADCIEKAILKYYASLKYIEESRDTFGRAAIWFMDIRDRDLAVKQLPMYELCLCKPNPCVCMPEALNYQLIPQGDTSYFVPPVTAHKFNYCRRDVETRRLYDRKVDVDVTPSHCKSNCGPGYGGILQGNSTAFKSHRLSELTQELEEPQPGPSGLQSWDNLRVLSWNSNESLGRKPEWESESDHNQKNGLPVKGRGRARCRRVNAD